METIFSKIEKYNKSLLKEQVAVKYKQMNKNIYCFFRGSCHLFYEDLNMETKLPSSPLVWMCGDLHLENFGSYKGDNRLVYFDINDFDESILAPASWELMRFITSVFIAFASLKIEQKKAENMVVLFLKVYSETLAKGKSFYIEPKTARGIVCNFLTAVSKRTQRKLLSKRTIKKGKKRILAVDKKRLPISKTRKKKLFAHINRWIIHNNGRPYNYEVIDVVFRVAGIGSLGLKRYLFLLKSTNIKEKYLLVDMKQSRSSSLSPYVKVKQPVWNNEAERISSIQDRMQNIAPFLLSETIFEGKSFVLQELQPTKDSINFNLIKNQYRDIYQVINDMAILTASAQLRSASRQYAAGVDELIKFGKNDKWHRSLIKTAIMLSKKTGEHYLSFRKEFKSNSRTDRSGNI